MPTNYQQITEENIGRYGTAIDEYGPLLLSDRYGDRTHFVYELLQNAEDAIGWRLLREERFPKEVSFELLDDNLLFRHHGLPFAEEHVRGICNIGKGTKARDLTAIGKHGIGFKSVYAYTHHPEVHSEDEHFVIDWFVRPRAVTPRTADDGETLFYFPFDHPEVSVTDARAEIAGRLKAIGLKTLLFLRNVESIAWTLASGGTGQYLRDSKALAEGVDRITLLGKESGKDEAMQEWLVFSRPVLHKERPAGFVEVAFSIESDGENRQDRVVAVHESPLVVFFPTEKATHFGFLLQGPYRTTPSRDNIPKDDPWNKYLVSVTAELLVDALGKLRDLALLDVDALEALIVDPLKYSPESQAAMFQPVANAIVLAMKREKLIPRYGGGHIAGVNARLARAENLRNILAPDQLKQITKSATEADWAVGDITRTRDRTRDLHAFLTNVIGIQEIDAEDFVRLLTGEFLRCQPDDWIARFYAFMLDQQAIRRRPWFAEKAIVRLDDGSHVSPFKPDGTPNAYLPSSDRTEFPTVKPSVCRNAEAMSFLKQLGLKEPDPVDDVIHNILPRYTKQSTDFPATYDVDVQRIIEAFQTDSARRRAELVERLTNAWWIPCRNAKTDEVILGVAGNDTYLPTEKLLALFDENPSVWFVDRSRPSLQGKKSQAVLEACGVAEYFQRTSVRPSLSENEKRRIRRDAGLESCRWESLDDYEIIGLEETLAKIADYGLEWQKLSLLLWGCLHDAIRHYREGLLYGQYSWSYSHDSRTVRIPAQFVRLLGDSPWLPGPDGESVAPSQVCFADLPDEYRTDANPDLVKLLDFKLDEIKQLAEKAGIDEEVLDIIRERGLSADELRKALGIDKPSGSEPPEPDSDVPPTGDAGAAIDDILGPDHPEPTAPGGIDTGNDPPIGTGSTSTGKGGRGTGGTGGDAGTGTGSGGTGGGSGGAGGGAAPGAGRKGEAGGGGSTGGSSRGSSHPAPRTHFNTYIAVDGEAPPHEQGESNERRMALEDAAIKLIQSEDGHLFATIRRMERNHEGYDLEAIGGDGDVERYIEVKAMGCCWAMRPATMSEPQFRMAQHHGNKYWLYVVENADQPNAKIHRIPNPAAKAKYFTFDSGWSSLADNPDNEDQGPG